VPGPLRPSSRPGVGLVRLLPEVQHDEFCRFQWREADLSVDDAGVDVCLGRGAPVTSDEVRVVFCIARERAAAEELVHEGADRQAKRRPEWFAVGLE
jgi:hypothetical protein